MSAVGRVISDRLDYDKLPDGRWRASFAGRLKATALARSPEEARRMVEADLDAQLAAWMAPIPEQPVIPTTDDQAKRERKKFNKVVRMRTR